jgi:hypothetical protein
MRLTKTNTSLDWFCGDKMQGGGYLKDNKMETLILISLTLTITINNHNDKEWYQYLSIISYLIVKLFLCLP